MTVTLAAAVRSGLWRPHSPPVRGRAVVVAPHPDDEVLGCGGLLCWLATASVVTEIVAVTDGEGSHPESKLISADELRRRRVRERDEALRRLGLALPVRRLRLADGRVAAHEDALVDRLDVVAHRDTTIVAPWVHDGHPDHEATGRAALRSSARTGAAVLQVLIWARVRPPAAVTSAQALGYLQLPAVTAAAKRHAAAAYRSQLRSVGPASDGADGPVVRPDEATRFLDGTEAYLW